MAAAAAAAPTTGVKRKACDGEEPSSTCIQAVQTLLGCTPALALTWLRGGAEQSNRDVHWHRILAAINKRFHPPEGEHPGGCPLCDLTPTGRSDAATIMRVLVDCYGLAVNAPSRFEVALGDACTVCVARVMLPYVSNEILQATFEYEVMRDHSIPRDITQSIVARLGTRYLSSSALLSAIRNSNESVTEAVLARIDHTAVAACGEDDGDCGTLRLQWTDVYTALTWVDVGWSACVMTHVGDAEARSTRIARCIRYKASLLNQQQMLCASAMCGTLKQWLLSDICAVVSVYVFRMIEF